MIDTLAEFPEYYTRVAQYVLQGINSASTDRASRLGHPVATVPPCEGEIASFARSAPADEAWTEEKNQRRCGLINQKYAGGLSPLETCELARLQGQMLRHRDRVAPLPIEDAQRLYKELLAGLSASRTPTDP